MRESRAELEAQNHIAIIPARGGSKRIPNKNLRPFHGIPIIQRTVKAAQNSGLFSKVIVSTDSTQIAMLAEQMGADVPFLRSKELSDDYTATHQVIVDCILRSDINFGFVTCIYPVTPLLKYDKISYAVELLIKENFDYVFAAGKLPTDPSRCFGLNEYGNISNVDYESLRKRTQELKNNFYDLGQFYSARVNTWKTNPNIIGVKSGAILLRPWEAIDVNEEEDWIYCERLFEQLESTD